MVFFFPNLVDPVDAVGFGNLLLGETCISRVKKISIMGARQVRSDRCVPHHG